MQPRDILAATPFFAEVLDAAALDRLAAGVGLVQFDKGAAIIREDDAGDSMFVIVAGAVSVNIAGDQGESRIATLGPADVFGEMSLMTGATRTATVRATEPVTAIEIAKPALEPILAAAPALVDRFAAMLDRRQAELDRVYGGRWNLFGLGTFDTRILIQGFFFGAV